MGSFVQIENFLGDRAGSRTAAKKSALCAGGGLNCRSADRRLGRRSLGLSIEEQRLADDRLDRVRAERLRDKERRLGRLPGEKAFRKSGYENHRDFLNPQNFIDRVEPRASVRKLNVGENEPGPAVQRRPHRLRMRPSDCCDVMTQLFDESLYVQSDERFILDNQDIRVDLGGNLLSRALNEVGGL